MDYQKFILAVKEMAPDCQLKAISVWKDFVDENVRRGQFVEFEPVADQKLAVQKWLDVLYTGFCAVKESFGQQMAAAVINLSCKRCCLYPGEMMQVAICLENNKSAEEISAMIQSGEIDAANLFSPLSMQDAEKYMSAVGVKHQKPVSEQLSSQSALTEHKKQAQKERTEREL